MTESYITPEIFEQFLKLIPRVANRKKPLKNSQWKLLFQIMYYGSLRVSEASNLSLQEIDFKKREIHLPGKRSKNRLPRIVTIGNNNTWKNLKRYVLYMNLKQNSYLFQSKYTGDPINRKTVYDYCYKICELINDLEISHRAGKKIYTHGYTHFLRKSSASYMAHNGISLDEVKEKLDHSDIRITQHYLIPETISNRKLKENTLFN